ncbi:putative remorin [Helianthus annuus]|nr:putative remorin [Helianthus annuus]
MPEFAFHDHPNRRLRSTYGGPTASDASPDSSIFTLFSSSASGSASIESCSSASDVLDHDSRVSDMLQHSSSERGSDPDPKRKSTVRNNGGPYLIGKKVDKVEAIKEYLDEETDAENQTVCSARSSFSYKDCEKRKLRSEILLRKSDRRRPASLDLNGQTMNVTSSSPRLGSTVKTSRRRGAFPSPGTPNYHLASVGVQKGWSSERVPLHTSTNRSTSMPYNNGKTLPSKWEDAERWIVSPVAADNGLKPSVQQQNRPMSKSGPLGPHDAACYSAYSPAVANFVTESPHLTGVNVDYNSLIQYQSGFENNGNFSSLMDHCIARSVSIHGCSELLGHSQLRITQDEKIGCSIDAATNVSRDVSRRDMATQMSPESSPCSSPRKSTSSSILAIYTQHVCSSKSDIRDVQVDDQVTLTPYTKKSRGQSSGKGSNIVVDWKDEGSEMIKSLSKVQREEAKITAWENLQKAKADAAIRKLEMKLEKKRSSSMDRIIHKLQSAQKKAHEMRELVSSNQPHQVAKSSHKTVSLIKTCNVRFLTGCFTCPAF